MKNKKFRIILGLVFSAWAFTNGLLAAEELKLGATLDDAGVFIAMEDGNQLNVRVIENNFQIYSVDSAKKLIKADIEKVIIHAQSRVNRGSSKQTIVLKPSDKEFMLTSGRFVPPPHHYELRLIVMHKGKKEVVPMTVLNQLSE